MKDSTLIKWQVDYTGMSENDGITEADFRPKSPSRKMESQKQNTKRDFRNGIKQEPINSYTRVESLR